MNLRVLTEPELEFGGGGTHVDVRFGLMSSGPLDRETPLAPSTLRVGLIGTEETIEGVRGWLEKCREEIPAKESRLTNLFPRFPGFRPDGCFRSTLQFHDRWTAAIHPREIEAIKDQPKTAASEAADLFIGHARRVLDQAGPMVLVCAPPADLLGALDVPRPRLDPADAELDEGSDAGTIHALVDQASFHDLLKARGMALGVPIQMTRPSTYLGKKGGRRRKNSATVLKPLQDEATRAWNFHMALYYKAGGVPWRLTRDASDLTTCFVGVSFYRTLDRERLLTSVAQVFNERGEGVIVQGGPARLEKDDRQPHLAQDDAHKLLVGAVAAYRQEHRTMPARVVVHKTSAFDAGELAGFRGAADAERIDSIDLVSIRRSFTRLFRSGVYPPLRGTELALDGDRRLLYLRGSVNFFETYPGLYVPRPLEFHKEYGTSTPAVLSEEIFGLSKLNWNNTQFDGGEPITVRAARNVGDMLKNVPAGAAIQSRFRFYM